MMCLLDDIIMSGATLPVKPEVLQTCCVGMGFLPNSQRASNGPEQGIPCLHQGSGDFTLLYFCLPFLSVPFSLKN